jgi:hypothetical protein
MILKQRYTHDEQATRTAHAFIHETMPVSAHGDSETNGHAREALSAPSTSTRLAATGSRLVAIGAVAYVVHLVVRSLLTAGVDPVAAAQSALWLPANALGTLGAALVLLGLPAILGGNTRPVGRAGLIGFVLLEVSWIFFGLFLSLYGALILPWLAEQAPRLVDGTAPTPPAIQMAFVFGFLAWLVGAVLVAIPLLKGPARTRRVGVILPASALWALVGSLVIAPDGPASNLAVNLLSNLGPALLLTGLADLALQVTVNHAPTGHRTTDANR